MENFLVTLVFDSVRARTRRMQEDEPDGTPDAVDLSQSS
jgi:hypothetical protein